jgi:hypothetical protein
MKYNDGNRDLIYAAYMDTIDNKAEELDNYNKSMGEIKSKIRVLRNEFTSMKVVRERMH